MRVKIFVDESYDGFFDLSKDDGYFCMALLLVPETELTIFERLFKEYRIQLATALGRNVATKVGFEVKSKHLRTIPDDIRRNLLKPIIEWARESGARVGGFYTSTLSYIKYAIRTDAAGEDVLSYGIVDRERIAMARKDIREQRASKPAESLMVSDMVKVIAGMLLHYCANHDMEFIICYDPRSKEEDELVFASIEELIRPLEVPILGKSGVFLGCDNSVESKQSPGLQMADHVTRDLRNMFKNHPGLLTEFANDNLITPNSVRDDQAILTELAGQQFKWGESLAMSEKLVVELFSQKASFCMTDYRDILLAHRVSCYSASGQARVLNFSDFSFANMVD